MPLRACLRAAFAALLLTAILAGPAQAARLKPTTLSSPASNAVVSALPPFSWAKVAGADHYDFEIAADAGFNSPVEGNEADKFSTKNTSATLVEAIPNGEYWWRVRAVTKEGGVSPWTKGRSFSMNWVETPKPLSPDNLGTVSFPRPATLVWSPVPGAARYKVLLASDSALGSLVYNRTTVYTQATRFTPEVQLAPGTYYWQITPLDARGHEGAPSDIWSFTWAWPSTVSGLQVSDLRGEAEVTEPHFTWTRVVGASGYYIEINPSADFAPSSMVCCGRVTGVTPTYDTLLAPEVTPRELFKDNDRYYWRVSAIDSGGRRGPWTEGTPFAKKFDKVPPVTGPAIKNLRMRDNGGEGAPLDLSGNAGLQTAVPIVRWDPVPGASMYQVDVVPYTMEQGTVTFGSVGAGTSVAVYHSGTLTPATIYTTASGEVPRTNPSTTSGPSTTGFSFYARPGVYDVYVNGLYVDTRTLLEGCDWQADSPHWESKTAVPYWTPLGDGAPSSRPFNSATGVSTDGDELTLGGYCVKVRAQSDRAGNEDVFGDWTYLNGVDGHEAAFVYAASSSVPCSPTCVPGYMGAADFLEPSSGVNVSRTPLFTWRDIAPAYWIIVARDPNFSNVVDYALTQIPAYAPRQRNGVTTYPDDSIYYWTVLPAQNPDGTGAVTDPLRSKSSFGKASVPPALVAAHAAGRMSADPAVSDCDPAFNQATVVGTPTYCWTGAEGAREYVLQAAGDVGFTKIYEEVVTNSTSYTSTKTYEGDTVFWRVRANDELQRGLTWSAIGSFSRQLPIPLPSLTNINVSDGLPTWAWQPAEGAQTYDVEITLPDGRKATFDKNYSTASDPTEMTGTGIFHWRVRARFPGGTSAVPGPWSADQEFTRTIPEPLGPSVNTKHGVLLEWQSRPGVKSYLVEIARREDFKATIETVHTDATNYAPKMDKKEYEDGGVLYWRVAAKDQKDTVGAFTSIRQIKISPRMIVKTTGFLRKGQVVTVSFKVTTFDKKNVYKAFVKANGKPLKKPTGARTNKNGVVKLKLKATKAGKVTYTITKAGNQAVTQTVDVR